MMQVLYYSLLFIVSGPLFWYSRENGNLCTDCGHSSLGVQLSLLCIITIPPHHWMQPDGARGLPQLHHPLSRWSGWELSVFALQPSAISYYYLCLMEFLHSIFVCLAGLISPWNLPLYLLTWKIAPAIATGNTVVAKPSEMTSVTAWMMCKLMQQAGMTT